MAIVWSSSLSSYLGSFGWGVSGMELSHGPRNWKYLGGSESIVRRIKDIKSIVKTIVEMRQLVGICKILRVQFCQPNIELRDGKSALAHRPVYRHIGQFIPIIYIIPDSNEPIRCQISIPTNLIINWTILFTNPETGLYVNWSTRFI